MRPTIDARGRFLPTHGHSRCGKKARPSPTFGSWSAMWDRCTRSRHSKFHLYGGRGITVCERWRDFAAFLADMGERPAGKSLDRLDRDKGYEPANCRWATDAEQSRNRPNIKRFTFNDLTLTIPEWSERTGLGVEVLRARLNKLGWPVEKALTSPIGTRRESQLIDLTGQRFGNLVVVRRVERPPNRLTHWLCVCDCGGTSTPTSFHLRHNRSRSCGCLQRIER